MADTSSIPIEPFTWSDLNLEQTFRLVEKYIPLKICHAHAIVPLKFSDNCLTIGSIDFDNPGVNLVISKLQSRKNLTIKGQQLDNKVFQSIISSYLNYQQNKKEETLLSAAPIPSQTKSGVPVTEKATFVIEEGSVFPSSAPGNGVVHAPAPSTTINNTDDKPTVIADDKATVMAGEENTILQGVPKTNFYPQDPKRSMPAVVVPNEPVPLRSPAPPKAPNDASRLDLSLHYLDYYSLDTLGDLPSQQLWQELLGRVLERGIGRLFFENHGKEGRILLSENGVMKEGLYGLPIQNFYRVINEFKRLAHLPPVPVLRPKKTEMEQYYKDERILLRLTIVPGKYGDEGTLQILRGKALVFHQQKQMDDQGREALQIAQQLERKIRHIHLRSQINPSSLRALPELLAACDRIKAQLNKIQR